MVLPVPVEPATSKCGMRVRSAKRGLPATSRPKAKTKDELEFWNSGDSKRLRNLTWVRTLLGISIPTKDWPGIGASMRMG